MTSRILSFISYLILISILIFSCQEEKKKTPPSTAFDTGRLFIESCLKGDFSSAEPLLYSDVENKNYFDIYKKNYETFTPSEKKAYQETDYIIQEIKEPNDSVCLIKYENNYKKEPTNIKLIRKNNQWKVDFKYTFNHQDSLK